MNAEHPERDLDVLGLVAALLRQLRIVTYRKAGKIAYYRLDDAHVAALLRDGFRHIEAEGTEAEGAEARP